MGVLVGGGMSRQIDGCKSCQRFLTAINKTRKKSSPRWVGGCVDGFKSCFKDCLEQSKIYIFMDKNISNTIKGNGTIVNIK